MRNIMFVGIQGSGKGTQARKILETYGDDFVLFEMGAELRNYANNGTPDGNTVREVLEAGMMVSVEHVVMMTENFIKNHEGKRIIIDGAIRSKEQNDALESIFGNFIVIYLELSEDEAVKRLVGRRIDPITQETFPASFTGETNPKTGNKLVTRADDTETSIRKRIAWSISDTLPLIGLWRQHSHEIYTISAKQDVNEIFNAVKKIIEKS